ncbi:hypothetical protein B7494_g4278 [Chlorociboria aeruginascens]|nr:hypothetical protein B7494_g4278 [Chlorociboria aeruginascens]
MSSNNASRVHDTLAREEEHIDLGALIRTDCGHLPPPAFNASSSSFFRGLEEFSVAEKFLCYPSAGSLKLRPTSWLDGVRGVAALGVYIFHTAACWAPTIAAWHSDETQNSILQMPVLRTLFVSGGPAISLFFVLSGYVLTHKSLRWIREGSMHQVYPAVASSMFRRGFRLYLPPLLLTFCEMLATRFGFPLPLNFSFVPESSLSAQFLDWLKETHHLINPVHIRI